MPSQREIVFFNSKEISKYLTMKKCIELMGNAFISVSDGSAFQPLRHVVIPPALGGLIALMTSSLSGNKPIFGYKAVTVFHDNPKQNKDAHQGTVTLLDESTGEPLAIFDASAITRIRTAAATAVATNLLAAQDSPVLSVIGSGVQARAHIESLLEVRNIKKINIVSRSIDNAHSFADYITQKHGIKTEAFIEVKDAVKDADIIVAATTSKNPVLHYDWVKAGAHVNIVGSCIPSHREVDSKFFKEASVFTDRIESLIKESGDYLLAKEELNLNESCIKGEIGEILTGKAEGRKTTQEITLFKSLGIAIEDIISARYIYDEANKDNGGQRVEF